MTHDRSTKQPTTRYSTAWPWPSIVIYTTGQAALTTAATLAGTDPTVAASAFGAMAVAGACLIAANTLSNHTRTQR